MVKTVAFLKPNGKIRNIAIEDVNKKVACTALFCHIKDEADRMLNSACQIKIMALVKEHFPTAWFFVKNILQTQNLWFFGGEDGIRSFKMKDGILQGRSNVYAVVLHFHYANDQRH